MRTNPADKIVVALWEFAGRQIEESHSNGLGGTALLIDLPQLVVPLKRAFPTLWVDLLLIKSMAGKYGRGPDSITHAQSTLVLPSKPTYPKTGYDLIAADGMLDMELMQWPYVQRLLVEGGIEMIVNKGVTRIAKGNRGVLVEHFQHESILEKIWRRLSWR